MERKLQYYVIALILSLMYLPHAQAGLIFFDDRDAFELALTSKITTERFEDGALSPDFEITRGKRGLYSTTSLNSDDSSQAVGVRERATLEVTFDYDVFAIGFDINQLNVSSLSYFDSAGHEAIDALLATEQWDASTFFGVISDVAITSFSLVGSGTSTNLYGFDDFSYTANPVSVNEPTTLYLMCFAIIAMLLIANRKHITQMLL